MIQCERTGLIPSLNTVAPPIPAVHHSDMETTASKPSGKRRRIAQENEKWNCQQDIGIETVSCRLVFRDVGAMEPGCGVFDHAVLTATERLRARDPMRIFPTQKFTWCDGFFRKPGWVSGFEAHSRAMMLPTKTLSIQIPKHCTIVVFRRPSEANTSSRGDASGVERLGIGNGRGWVEAMWVLVL